MDQTKNNLTAEYVADHRIGLHTTDSFARSLVERVLREAEGQLSQRGTSSQAALVEVPARVFVSPVQTSGCVQVCVQVGGAIVCYHVG